MKKGRLEAFSDGVVAIIITIMVLELHVPHGNDLHDLGAVAPQFLSYVLSFIYIGIYWNNHHHMFYLVERIDGAVLWANLNLLFWLSLIPFVTEWMGESHLTTGPVALFGAILFMCGVSYIILYRMLIRCQGKNEALSQAMGHDLKGLISISIYICAIALSFFKPVVSMILYWVVAVIWFIPDRRIERKLMEE